MPTLVTRSLALGLLTVIAGCYDTTAPNALCTKDASCPDGQHCSIAAQTCVEGAAPSVTVSPSSATVEISGTQQLSATVANASSSVTWSVQESAGGSVSSSGLYSAPSSAGVFHVVAASVDDPSRSGSAAITVLAKPVLASSSIGITPPAITGGSTAALSLALPILTNAAGTFSAGALALALTETGGGTPFCNSPAPAHACTTADLFAAISGGGAISIGAPASLASDNDSISYTFTAASLAPSATKQTATGSVSVVPLPALSGTAISISPATITAAHTGSLTVTLPTLTNAAGSYTSSTFVATLEDQAGITPTCNFPSPAHACTAGDLFTALSGNGTLTLAYPASVIGDDRSVTYTLSVENQATSPAKAAPATGSVTIVPAASGVFTVTTPINGQPAAMISSTLTQAKSGNLATAAANAGWSYAWTISGAGATINSGAATNQISFTAGTGTSMALQCAATNAAGDVDTQSVTITLVPPPQIASFSSTPGRIAIGSSFLLKPIFSGGDGSIDQGIGAVTSGGGLTLSPSAPTTYTLTVIDAAGDTTSQTSFISVSNIFVDGPPMITPRTLHTATLLADGRILFAGGFAALPNGGQQLTATSEIFDPAGNSGAGSFSSTGNLVVARANATASLLPDGRVLIAGGYNQGELSSTELFDPGASGGGAFTAGPNLSQPRNLGSSLPMPNGLVLLAGGSNSAGSIASLELFDASGNAGAGSISIGYSLTTSRISQVTFLLPNGLVWIAGGDTESGGSTTSVETYQLYDPVTGMLAPEEQLPFYSEDAHANLLPNGEVLLLDTAGQNSTIYDPFTDTFSSTAPLLTTRSQTVSQTLSTGLVLYAEGQSTDVELFDPAGNSAAGSFTAIEPLELKRFGSSMTLLGDGRVLIAGGQALESGRSVTVATTELYDPTGVGGTGRFASTGGLTTARAMTNAALLPNGKVLVAGGEVGTPGNYSPTNNAELYDPTASSNTGGFGPTGHMTGFRYQAAAARLPNGKVLIAGGCCTQSTAELYDPSGNSGAGSFSNTGALTSPRAGASATLLANGKVLLAGGFTGSANSTSAELFDPEGNSGAGTFSALTATMRLPRSGAVGVLLGDGTVLISGGCSVVVAACNVELFDPSGNSGAGTFSTINLNVTAPNGSGSTATRLNDGAVLMAGGFQQSAPTTAAFLFDARVGLFQVANLATARSGAIAALLPDGKVLIAGGTDVNGNTLASAELYDPVAQSFSPAGQLATPRTGGQAVLLPNAKLLIVGGFNGQTPLASAELFQLQ